MLFFLFVFLLNILAGIFLVNWLDLVNITQFFLLIFINFGLAYSLTELVLSLCLRKLDLPKIPTLVNVPAVALLYLTYNDVMPEVISTLKRQTYSNYKIFILDDSTAKDKKTILDKSGYEVIRRESRTGFKAGALNNWLSLYGDNYDYFVILDSDSLLPKYFVEEMVKYAEHPKNSTVGIFQSKTEIWNPRSKFAVNTVVGVPIWMHKLERLANDCDMLLPWGHNSLFRTGVIKKLGGFETGFVSEDFATDLKIISNGYGCKLVDLVSYEGTPQTIRSFTKRTIRWSSGALQLLRQKPDYIKSIPFSTGLYLFWTAYFYLIWLLYIPGMFISVWGHQSNIDDVIAIFSNSSLFRGTGLVQVTLILLYIVYFLVFNFAIALKTETARNFIKSIPLNAATSFYIMIPLVTAQLKVIFGKKPHFDVTEKSYLKISLFSIFKDMKFNLLFTGLLLLGTITNPAALVFNWFWFLLFIGSPFIIYFSQSPISQKKQE